MTTYKVADLTGALLDAAVAKAEDFPSFWIAPGADACMLGPVRAEDARFDWCPSSAWEQGGPILEREGITVTRLGSEDITQVRGARWRAKFDKDDITWGLFDAPTPLVAAMRAYVASKSGEWVDLPD